MDGKNLLRMVVWHSSGRIWWVEKGYIPYDYVQEKGLGAW